MRIAMPGHKSGKGWTSLWLGILLVAALGASPFAGMIEESAELRYQSVMTRALGTFSAARSLGVVMPVMQETEVALKPAVARVTLAPGQIVDQVNNLIVRFSRVMLAALVPPPLSLTRTVTRMQADHAARSAISCFL